jgi:hypothetical protein
MKIKELTRKGCMVQTAKSYWIPVNARSSYYVSMVDVYKIWRA